MTLLTRAILAFSPRCRILLSPGDDVTGDHPNEEAPLGGWRPLNLERAPFDLGPPLRLISEKESVEDARYVDKSLGLWALR